MLPYNSVCPYSSLEYQAAKECRGTFLGGSSLLSQTLHRLDEQSTTAAPVKATPSFARCFATLTFTACSGPGRFMGDRRGMPPEGAPKRDHLSTGF